MDRLRQLPLRLIALILAIALAAVATFALRDWLKGVEEDRLAEVELVQVLVARTNVAAGTSVEDAIALGAFDTAEYPRDTLPPTVITDLSQVAGLVVATPLLQGDILQPARFASVADVGAFLEIPADMQAISFEVTVTEGVANFINPGDHVNILAHIIPADTEQQATTVDPTVVQPIASDEEITRVLLQDVQVLQVGQRVTLTNEQGQRSDGISRGESSVMLTVAVTAVDAERVAYAVRAAALYLTLLPELEEDETFTETTTPGRTRENLYER